MMEPPRLPSAYRLVTVESGSDVREAATARAREGTDDGTLVWAPPAPDAEGAETNLRFGLVLYPETTLLEASELVYVAGLGLGEALGVLLAAGFDITLEWPGFVLLDGGKVAEITLDHAVTAKDQTVAWAVLGAEVNVAGAGEGSVIDTAILREEGWPEASANILLEHFARHFLTWVNRWLDDGFEPVRSMWMRRAPGLDGEMEVQLSRSRVKGTFLDIDQAGRLILRDTNRRRRRIEMRQTRSVMPHAG